MKQEYEYINAEYNKVKEEKSKAIQLTPRSYPRIVKKFMLWRKENKTNAELESKNIELSQLESKRTDYARSGYMIEQGKVKEIEKQIESLKETINFLEEEKDLINTEKNIQSKSTKPLRLVPKMFKSIKDKFYVATAKREKIEQEKTMTVADEKITEESKKNTVEKKAEKQYEVPLNITDFERKDNLKKLIDEKIDEQLKEKLPLEKESEELPTMSDEKINEQLKERLPLEDESEEINYELDFERIKPMPSEKPARLNMETPEPENKIINEDWVRKLEETLSKKISESKETSNIVKQNEEVETKSSESNESNIISEETEIKEDGTKVTHHEKETVYEFSKDNRKNTEKDELESLKEQFLKLQAEKDALSRKNEQVRLEKEKAEREAELAKQKREAAVKAREDAMNECIRASRMLQEEISRSMNEQKLYQEEINKNKAVAQAENSKAEQELQSIKELKAMINPQTVSEKNMNNNKVM